MSLGESGIPFSSDSDILEMKRYKDRIRGLTLLKNELYVTTERQNTVEVFDSKSKKIKKVLTFESLIEPGTMASCTINNCIYIIDKKLSRGPTGVFKYRPDADFASRWPTGAYGRLSVTKETADVVLAAYNNFREEKSMLKIFSTDGTELRTIVFSEHTKIESLWHAIELRHGDFIVSHGSSYHTCKSLLHRVCVVCKYGDNVKKSIGGKEGPGTNELNEPSCLAVTAKESILVADMKNHRVLLLSKDLTVKQVLFEDREHLPEIVYFDEENDQLFIGSNLKSESDGRVLCIPWSVE